MVIGEPPLGGEKQIGSQSMTIAHNDDDVQEPTAQELAAMAEAAEQDAFDAAARLKKVQKDLKAGRYMPNKRIQAMREEQRVARAEAFAATPKGRRLLAARAA